MAEKSKVYSGQSGDPGRLKVQLQFESEGLRTRRDHGFEVSLCPKAGEDQCPSLKTVRKK